MVGGGLDAGNAVLVERDGYRFLQAWEAEGLGGYRLACYGRGPDAAAGIERGAERGDAGVAEAEHAEKEG